MGTGSCGNKLKDLTLMQRASWCILSHYFKMRLMSVKCRYSGIEGLSVKAVVEIGNVRFKSLKDETFVFKRLKEYYTLQGSKIGTISTSARGIIIFIYCNWVVTRWQWLFYMYTKYEIGYY